VVRALITSLALVWSLGYAAAGIAWMLGVAGYPFAPRARQEPLSLIELLPQAYASPLIVLIALCGVGLASWLLITGRSPRRRAVRGILTAVFAGSLSAIVVVAVCDARIMAFVGYALSLRLQWPTPDIAHQGLMVLGALLWVGVAYAWSPNRGRRRSGPGAGDAGRVTVAARIAVMLAVVVPLLYATTRVLWLAGVPAGISEEMLREGQDSGLWWIGGGLALVAALGAVLTLGLVQRWGEVLPRWVPGLGGRRVPVMLAVVPATAASAVILTGGLMFVRLVLVDQMAIDENWATIGPELLWPVWGVALLCATVAYHRRRTGPRS